MPFSYVKLPGLNETKLLSLIEPVLQAHRVDGVELIWRGDRGGMVLEVTLERPGSRVPGEGITLDVCSDVSRDLSTALDVDELISARYRLEVGSPGVERALYTVADYQRFTGQLVKLKLSTPWLQDGPGKGSRVLRGTLFGVEGDQIHLEVDGGTLAVPFESVTQARLIFDWNASRGQKASGGKTAPKGTRGAEKKRPRKDTE